MRRSSLAYGCSNLFTGEKEVYRQEGDWISGSCSHLCVRYKCFNTGHSYNYYFVQFCPSDSSKVMVTSADSQVRILSGVNVMCKFKGEY